MRQSKGLQKYLVVILCVLRFLLLMMYLLQKISPGWFCDVNKECFVQLAVLYTVREAMFKQVTYLQTGIASLSCQTLHYNNLSYTKKNSSNPSSLI